jgi:hypothetical protein
MTMDGEWTESSTTKWYFLSSLYSVRPQQVVISRAFGVACSAHEKAASVRWGEGQMPLRGS